MIALAIIAALLVLHAVSYGFLSDDAFIIARYARNVVRGHGWVYNPGDRVEGYTSFLWVALTSALGATGADYVVAIRGLSIAGAVGCVVILHRWAKRLELDHGPWWPCAAPAMLAACGVFACWALGGLEACGYAFLILITAYLLTDPAMTPRHAACAGVMAGLCALTRPEGLLIALVLAAWLLSTRMDRNKTPPLLAYLLPTIMVAGAHLLWRRYYYGDWLPNTFYVKVGTSWDQIIRGARYLADGVAENGGPALWIIPLAAPWLPGMNRAARCLSLIAAAMIAGTVIVGGDGLPMYRFFVPIIPPWLLLLTWLMRVLAVRLGGDDAAPTRRRRAAATGVLAVSFVIVAPLYLQSPSSLAYVLYRDQLLEIDEWSAAGRWLAENAPRDATVACCPIGAVGYYSDLHVHDMLGLTDRHIAHKEVPLGAGWAGHEKHDGPYVLAQRPTYLLLGNVQVLDKPLATNHPYFCRPPAPAIRAREDDIFTPELYRNYQPRVAELPDGRYLHLLERRGP